MSRPEIVVSADSKQLAAIAARRFVAIVRSAQDEAEHATVSLSGGSTPRALFSLLASDGYRVPIDWRTVDIFWGDERTVPPDHADSNFRMAREMLLSHIPIPDERVHRMRGELDPEKAAADYEQAIQAVFPDSSPDNPPNFDLILLGVGADGHTASLFPNTAALAVRNRLVVANQVPQQETTRLSFTVPVLLAARHVMLLATGSGKAQAVKRAIEGDWDPTQTPSQYLREASGQVIWMLDQAAASMLSSVRGG